jgi:hypothetical protein
MPTVRAGAQPVIFEQPLSARIANYAIDVALHAEDRTLDARETLTWHNGSADSLGELHFHLYLNAFRNNRSTLFEESGHWRGTEYAEAEGWGYSEITRIETTSGEDLTDRMEFIQPDDDNQSDKTVFRLPLPKPLAPGDSIRLEIDFVAKLPSPPFRTGVKEEYFFVGQWYPKVGVFIDGAWNCHQFHSASEFFADFGVYDVHITVPEDHIVGATGIEVDVRSNDDGTATHYYHAEDVHDFAWTSSPEFVAFTGDTQDVRIRVLMQPDRVGQVERYLEATKLAVAYMQDWIGDYPYPNLTVVDPRRGAIGSAGMEYPTLFTTVGAYGLPRGLKLQESTTIHEFAHAYWHLMLATNEFEEPWLDEGFTVYSEAKICAAAYGPVGDQIDLLGVRINNWTYTRAPVIDAAEYDQMARYAWEYYSEGIGAINSYFKPALMLRTLENYLGEETMTRILRTYYERWRFKHPHTQDFIEIVNEVSGQDLSWFFDQVLYSNAVLDYSVSRVKSKKIKAGEGYDFDLKPVAEGEPDEENRGDDSTHTEDDTGISHSGTPGGRADSEAVADSTQEAEAKDTYLSEVKVRRLGSFVFPVTVEIKFDDGETIRETWDGKDHWRRWRYTRQAELVSATVDPDFLIPLDINYTNNSRTVEPQGVGIAKLCVRALFWAQFLLDQPDFLNLATLAGGIRLE